MFMDLFPGTYSSKVIGSRLHWDKQHNIFDHKSTKNNYCINSRYRDLIHFERRFIFLTFSVQKTSYHCYNDGLLSQDNKDIVTIVLTQKRIQGPEFFFTRSNTTSCIYIYILAS
uniref:Uncharacterized protein n=1 Tax=Cacopsylla melanoneura TaxID=428564 RepID=A0A8D8TEC4_9HEMI